MRTYILRSALLIALLAIMVTSTLAVPASAAPSAQLAPGALDPTFGGFTDDGIVVETRLQGGKGMAIQPDGKIVVVGNVGTSTRLMVIRYLPNGQRDPSFGYDGMANFRNMFPAVDVAIQSDGRIVVGGTLSENRQLARLTSSGALDTTFGGDGWIEEPSYIDYFDAVMVQSDGKIVACGHIGSVAGDIKDFHITRYNADGSPDSSFGTDSRVFIAFGAQDVCDEVISYPDGKLVVVGTRRPDGNTSADSDFIVARLNNDGTLDTSFDNDGKLSTGFGGAENATAVALLPDRKLVVLGPNGDSFSTSVARYLPDGRLDSTFDKDGKLTIRTDRLSELALLPDGKMVALGYHKSPDGDTKFVVYRLHPNGALDTSFDFDGAAAYDFGGLDNGTALALQPDGRILAAGTNGTSAVLIRLWPSGTTPDTGGQQTHSLDIPGRNELTSALAVQSDGKLLVAGQANASGSVNSAFVSRFLADGQIDSSFGYVGTAQVFGGTMSAAHAIAVQPDGKIVIAGYATGPGSTGSGSVTDDFLVARFHANGTADSTFGTKGVYRLDFAGAAERVNGLALTSDGKIVVAGNVMYNGRQIWGIARLTSSGALDPTFSYSAGPGKVLLDFGSNSAPNAVVLQPDGKVLLGGKTGAEDFVVARLLASGPLDTTFGPNGAGYTITDMGGADAVVGLGLAPNGWIYAAGFSWRGGTAEDFALAQYQPNGTLPQCPSGQTCAFWPGGLRFINVGGSDSAYSLVMRSDNELVAAGCSDGQMAAAQVSTTNINAVPLVFKTDFVGEFECANGVQFSDASKSKIVLAGWQSYNNDYNIGLARFQTTSQMLAPAAPSSPEPNAAPEPSAEQPATDSVVQETPADDVSTPTTIPDGTQKDAPTADVSAPPPDDIVKEAPAEDVSTHSNDFQP